MGIFGVKRVTNSIPYISLLRNLVYKTFVKLQRTNNTTNINKKYRFNNSTNSTIVCY